MDQSQQQQSSKQAMIYICGGMYFNLKFLEPGNVISYDHKIFCQSKIHILRFPRVVDQICQNSLALSPDRKP